MNIEEVNLNIGYRNRLLKEIKNRTDQELSNLLDQIKMDHQSIILNESKAESDNEQEQLRSLRMEIEAQESIITKYKAVQYQKFAKTFFPDIPVLKNAVRAFIIGGGICVFGQIIINFMMIFQGMDFKNASIIASLSIVVLTAIFTGFGIYDELVRFGGAGATVPITGFANSIVSSAIEFKREGYVYGVGAKIFTIAGPVILYGTLTSVIIGLITFIIQ